MSESSEKQQKRPLTLEEMFQALVESNNSVLKSLREGQRNLDEKFLEQQKNFDTKWTKLSSNMASIQKIWGKKDYETNSTSLS